MSGSLCAPETSTSPYSHSQSHFEVRARSDLETITGHSGLETLAQGWSEEGCTRIVTLVQLTLAAGIFAATLLQFVGALYVRGYAQRLWVEEIVEEEGRVVLVEEGSLIDIEGVAEKQ